MWLLFRQKKAKKFDYLGCKCFVLTLFLYSSKTRALGKKYRELFLRTLVSASFVLFLFLEVSLLVLLVNGFFHTVLLVRTCFIFTH